MSFDPKKPVRTRYGGKARIVCTDADGLYPIVALIRSEKGDECEAAYLFTADGCYAGTSTSTGWDLVNVPEKRVGWVNVYRSQSDDTIHPNSHNADLCALSIRIACVKVEYEVPA